MGSNLTINVIIRVDDINNKFDFYDLRKWFLKKFPQIPVCFYVCSTHLRNKWDKWSWIKVKKTIIHNGWEIGGHSRIHLPLNKVPKEELKFLIEDNIKDIESNLELVNLRYKVTSFAYPFGVFNDNVKTVLKKNKIVHGLSFPQDTMNFKAQMTISSKFLYEIGISSGEAGSVKKWNNRFNEVYANGDLYIICLHTSHWIRGENIKSLFRILKPSSPKMLINSIKRFMHQFKKKSNKHLWNILEEHLNFIKKHIDIQFITFKQLLDQ